LLFSRTPLSPPSLTTIVSVSEGAVHFYPLFRRNISSPGNVCCSSPHRWQSLLRRPTVQSSNLPATTRILPPKTRVFLFLSLLFQDGTSSCFSDQPGSCDTRHNLSLSWKDHPPPSPHVQKTSLSMVFHNPLLPRG